MMKTGASGSDLIGGRWTSPFSHRDKVFCTIDRTALRTTACSLDEIGMTCSPSGPADQPPRPAEEPIIERGPSSHFRRQYIPETRSHGRGGLRKRRIDPNATERPVVASDGERFGGAASIVRRLRRNRA